MRGTFSFLSGLVWGGAAMYFFDSRLGRHRRSLLRDGLGRDARTCMGFVECASRDLAHRAAGFLYEGKALLAEPPVDDRVLAERVRSQVGRSSSHPRAIEVAAHDGRITLRGPVLAHEVAGLMANVQSVRGVHEIENRLDVHDSPENIPSLQGEQRPRREGKVTPAARLIVYTVGGLLLAAARRHIPAACLLSTGALAMMARTMRSEEGGMSGNRSNGRRQGTAERMPDTPRYASEDIVEPWTRERQ